MNQEVSIRNVVQSDFIGIYELLKQLWPDISLDFNVTNFVFTRNLNAEYKRLLCAETNTNIVGFCSLTIKDNLRQQGLLGNIDELVIEESFQGKGIGEKLLGSMLDIARKIGCKKVELDSSLHRKRAHKFYKVMGFEIRAYLFSKTV